MRQPSAQRSPFPRSAAVHRILRVETDSGSAAYEAHIQKADGSVITVRFDKDLQVIDTIEGFGPNPQA
ncbi:MAG: hypothetical protein ABJB55_01955 [Actinomycetota bacterium]